MFLKEEEPKEEKSFQLNCNLNGWWGWAGDSSFFLEKGIMLPTINRITKTSDFQTIFKRSKPLATLNLMLRVKRTSFDYVRFGFIISNKVEKRAVNRNTTKRKLRAVAASLISDLKKGYDIVVVVKKPFSKPVDYEALKQQFIEGMRKAGLFR